MVTDQTFSLQSDYSPKGDQGKAIASLSDGIVKGKPHQVLLGVTGSGKTFTMANVIANVQRPTLVVVHNKTLAAQLYQEFKGFFPDNAVEYFVSYYDYYQPEAYIPTTDTYIAKDASINDTIDQMRHAATTALLERNRRDDAAGRVPVEQRREVEPGDRTERSERQDDARSPDERISRLVPARAGRVDHRPRDLDSVRGRRHVPRRELVTVTSI